MVCFDCFGMTLALDFTAPALLALLSLILPAEALLQTLAASLLHECTHLLTIALLRQKPALLRISAAGLRLETAGSAVMPLPAFAAILCAGPLANLAAAAGFAALRLYPASAANLALCIFNLLPFRSTDGGTLLFSLLEYFLLPRIPELPQRMMRMIALLTAALLLTGMVRFGFTNPSLCGMILFMLLSELL